MPTVTDPPSSGPVPSWGRPGPERRPSRPATVTGLPAGRPAGGLPPVGSSAAGASKARIAAVERWREGDEFDSAERAALALADAATSTPAEVSDEVFAEARRHFSEQQLVELAATVALEKLPGLPHPSSLWNPRVSMAGGRNRPGNDVPTPSRPETPEGGPRAWTRGSDTVEVSAGTMRRLVTA